MNNVIFLLIVVIIAAIVCLCWNSKSKEDMKYSQEDSNLSSFARSNSHEDFDRYIEDRPKENARYLQMYEGLDRYLENPNVVVKETPVTRYFEELRNYQPYEFDLLP